MTFILLYLGYKIDRYSRSVNIMNSLFGQIKCLLLE